MDSRNQMRRRMPSGIYREPNLT